MNNITASLARYETATTHTSRDLTLEGQITRRFGMAPVVVPPVAPCDDEVDADAIPLPLPISEDSE